MKRKEDSAERGYHVLICGRQRAIHASSAQAALSKSIELLGAEQIESFASGTGAIFEVRLANSSIPKDDKPDDDLWHSIHGAMMVPTDCVEVGHYDERPEGPYQCCVLADEIYRRVRGTIPRDTDIQKGHE